MEGIQPDKQSSQSSAEGGSGAAEELREDEEPGTGDRGYVGEDLGVWKYDLDNCLGCSPEENKAKTVGFMEH